MHSMLRYCARGAGRKRREMSLEGHAIVAPPRCARRGSLSTPTVPASMAHGSEETWDRCSGGGGIEQVGELICLRQPVFFGTLASAMRLLFQRCAPGDETGATLDSEWKPPRTVQILPWRVPGFSLGSFRASQDGVESGREIAMVAVRLPMSPVVAGQQRGRGKSCKGLVASSPRQGIRESTVDHHSKSGGGRLVPGNLQRSHQALVRSGDIPRYPIPRFFVPNTSTIGRWPDAIRGAVVVASSL